RSLISRHPDLGQIRIPEWSSSAFHAKGGGPKHGERHVLTRTHDEKFDRPQVHPGDLQVTTRRVIRTAPIRVGPIADYVLTNHGQIDPTGERASARRPVG